MLDADTIERARRVVAGLRGAELRAAAPPWETDRDGNILTTGQDREDVAIFGTPNFEPDGGDMAAIVALRNAAPALLACAEFVLAIVNEGRVLLPSPGVSDCSGCEDWNDYDLTDARRVIAGASRDREDDFRVHAPDCPWSLGLAARAALAALDATP